MASNSNHNVTEIDHFLADKSHVIWDWNGTLLNDIEMCVEIISSLLTKHGYQPISESDYKKQFRFPIKQYYQDIGFDFNKVPFEVVALEFIQAYNQKVHECSLFHGTASLLDRLNVKGLKNSVLSAAHEGDLKNLLNAHNLTEHFLKIYGLGDHYAASKTVRGLQLIEDLAAPKKDIIMFGDTDHDVEVAKAMGIDIVLFGDGHQCANRLANLHDLVLIRCKKSGAVSRHQLRDAAPVL